MALLYSNENFPRPVVEELRRLGHDVLTVLEAGKAEQAIEDDEVLAFAVSLGRTVFNSLQSHLANCLGDACGYRLRLTSACADCRRGLCRSDSLLTR